MRTRAWVAAVAGASAAATAHLLDVTARLPFVHETHAVRGGMTAAQALAWLAIAGLASAAASYRLALLGLPVAMAVTGAPELLARHDLGAVAEPGALVGAALQLPVLVAIVAVALVAERRVPSPAHRCPPALPVVRASKAPAPLSSSPAHSWGSPRAPPSVVSFANC